MNASTIIAGASRCYKHPLISWNREVYLPVSAILDGPGAKGDVKIMVCKTAGGPAVSYQLGTTCGDGGGFTWFWNSPRQSSRLKVSRWTQKACEDAFADAINNAPEIVRALVAQL